MPVSPLFGLQVVFNDMNLDITDDQCPALLQGWLVATGDNTSDYNLVLPTTPVIFNCLTNITLLPVNIGAYVDVMMLNLTNDSFFLTSPDGGVVFQAVGSDEVKSGSSPPIDGYCACFRFLCTDASLGSERFLAIRLDRWV